MEGVQFRLQFGERELALRRGTWRIGRDPVCEVRLKDEAVSRHHASLHVRTEQVHLQDHGSRNGVHVNDRRVEGVIELKHGDRITIGAEEFRVLIEEGHDFTPPTAAIPKLGLGGDKRPALSRREREVLTMIAQGHTLRAIAETLGVSTKSVETYRARIRNKLGLRTRADLVAYALDHNILPRA